MYIHTYTHTYIHPCICISSALVEIFCMEMRRPPDKCTQCLLAYARAEAASARKAHCSIRQHTSAYIRIRQHTSAYVSSPCNRCNIRSSLRIIQCLFQFSSNLVYQWYDIGHATGCRQQANGFGCATAFSQGVPALGDSFRSYHAGLG
jgi:hypothetical protein